MRITARQIIWYILNLYEGWYVDDPDDKGGETFRGISRVSHPSWYGWKLVDAVKNKTDFESVIRKSKALKEYVLDFYEKEYWRKLRLYDIPVEISAEMFEQAINFGDPKAARNLQLSVNALNYDICENIEVDGRIGNMTVDAVRKVAKTRKTQLIKALNSLQGSRYIGLMLKRRANKKYIGWFSRVSFTLYEEIKSAYEHGKI